MSLRVLFFASLADLVGRHEATLDASEFQTVDSVFSKFVEDYPRLEEHRPTVMVAVNSEFAQHDTRVKDGDEIAFLPPVSGG